MLARDFHSSACGITTNSAGSAGRACRIFDGVTRPAQSRRVAANQAFFEFQPGRFFKPSGASLDTFDAPKVENVPITKFDQNGMGQEPNNLIAINSLRGYRALRWGRNVELIITDQRSFRSEDPGGSDDADVFASPDFPSFVPQEVMEILDGGSAYNNGHPPATIPYGGKEVPNFRKDKPPQTILGAEQKSWFLDRLKSSKATWKIWGDTIATLEMRADPQNLPVGITKAWPGAAYAGFGSGDHSTAFVERADIYDFVRDNGITGFATIAGDRHSFWAGYSTQNLFRRKNLNPLESLSSQAPSPLRGWWKRFEHNFPKQHPLRALFLGQGPADTKPQPTVNLLLRHGVNSCLEYAKSGDIKKARALSNPNLSPHLSFVDMGGHGYAVVRATSDCISIRIRLHPAPHRAQRPSRWRPPGLPRPPHRQSLAQRRIPKLETRVIEGDPKFSI